MAGPFQTVGIGSTANDGLGDSLRTALAKINANLGFCAEVANVRTYGGAAIDGSTDDTSAIANTASYLNSHGGGICYIPPGSGACMVSGALPNYNYVYYVGAGPVASKIKCKSTFSTTASVFGEWTTAVSNYGIVGIEIDMDRGSLSWPTDDNYGNAIMVGSGSSNVLLADLNIHDTVNNAVVCYLSADVDIDRMRAYSIGKGATPGLGIPLGGRFTACGLQLAASSRVRLSRSSINTTNQYCIWLQNRGGVVQEVEISYNRLVGSYSDCIFIGDDHTTSSAEKCAIVHNKIAGNGTGISGGVGLRAVVSELGNIDDLEVKHNTFWNNATMGAIIDSGCRYAQVEGNKFVSNGQYGLREHGSYSQVIGNSARGHSIANYLCDGSNLSMLAGTNQDI